MKSAGFLARGYDLGFLRKAVIQIMTQQNSHDMERKYQGAGRRRLFAVDIKDVGAKFTLPDVVRPEGFEPPAFWSVARRSIQLS